MSRSKGLTIKPANIVLPIVATTDSLNFNCLFVSF